ncbi:hypothetical protein [Burkholderia thailandensis]|uniref:hypothetical protein n=1 Tax=Burkholderia thailandensis TaxID=57975 RepID=UPI000A3FC6A8|nr:hypothetical protein [Burkholderia thailandensis]MCS3394684.1 hypothetical protein [Burkholderia thailandensis]MCS6429061.1 hypothetical protein [Burkholderia thailandensis]MCS6456110.1 hypothetical protein [Burkholderia thailandensis]MCS6467159.1 hypothetical protein [Burkholderia thailandensis]MCS6485701.1 hypothetical protein [Burkholderia thailandensis]
MNTPLSTHSPNFKSLVRRLAARLHALVTTRNCRDLLAWKTRKELERLLPTGTPMTQVGWRLGPPHQAVEHPGGYVTWIFLSDGQWLREPGRLLMWSGQTRSLKLTFDREQILTQMQLD